MGRPKANSQGIDDQTAIEVLLRLEALLRETNTYLKALNERAIDISHMIRGRYIPRLDVDEPAPPKYQANWIDRWLNDHGFKLQGMSDDVKDIIVKGEFMSPRAVAAHGAANFMVKGHKYQTVKDIDDYLMKTYKLKLAD